MSKKLTAGELSKLMQLKGNSTLSLYEKIQDMLGKVIKDWLEKRNPAIEYNKEENTRLIKSQSNKLYYFFKSHEITGLDDEAMQLLESRIKEDLHNQTKPHHERKKMMAVLNGVTCVIMSRINDSLEKK